MTCVCGRPLTGAYLCADCTHNLDIAIANISAHWQDLDNVRAKLTRYGGQGGPTDHLPIDPRFARYVWVEANNRITGEAELQCRIPDGTALLDAVRNTVATWVLVVQGQWTAAAARRMFPPPDNVPACCRWLLGWTKRIAIAPWGPDILDEMEHLARQLEQLVDRPADKWYAGPCDMCRRDLYARTGAAEVTCAECGIDYPVQARRKQLLEQAEDHLVTAATLSRAVSWLGGMPLAQDRIRQWAKRGRIIAKGHERNGQVNPLYRVGDALDLLAAERQKVG